MKRAHVTVTMVLMVAGTAFHAFPAQAQYDRGSGTPSDPYLIYTAMQMNAIGDNPRDWDKHFKLMADIDLSGCTGANFNMIGNGDTPFTGVFDGNWHEIRNFKYATANADEVGLFGRQSGEIRNVGLVEPNVVAEGSYYVGGLVGRSDGQISNCYVSGGSVAGYESVGGLVGGRYGGGMITCCYSSADVFAYRQVGGLVGRNSGLISDCYATGNVTGDYRVGGLIGEHWGSIYNCYSVGEVVGSGVVGGLVGVRGGRGCLVFYSFWDIETSKQTTSSGGTGKTTGEMQDPNTFLAAGWDFVGKSDGPSDVWAGPNDGGYPILWHQLDPLPDLPFAGGSGTDADPFVVVDGKQLGSIGYNPRLMDAHIELGTDVNLADVNFFMIGCEAYPFRGVFGGNGHTISNLALDCIQDASFGMFSLVTGAEAQIRNVHFVNVDINTPHGRDVGSLVGYLKGGTVINCSVRGGLITGNYHVGGLIGSNAGLIVDCHADCNVTSVDYACGVLVGDNRGRIWKSYANGTASSTDGTVGGLVGINGGKVLKCFASASVSGDRVVGGLVGMNYNGMISECFAWASVSGDRVVGGLVGRNYHGMIAECFALSSVNGDSYVGGLVGWNEWGVVLESYSAGPVSGYFGIGGLAGYNERGGKIYNCYSAGAVSGGGVSGGGLVAGTSSEYTVIEGSFWDIESSGRMYSAGGTGLTTAEMLDVNTFIAAGWDFVGEFENGPSDIWAQPPSGGYPIFWWQLDPLPPLPTFSGGSGTSDNPYRIADARDLTRIGHNPRLMDKHFLLINDVNLINVNSFPIGSLIHPFTGKFNGNGNTICHLDINYTEEEYVGLFRYVDGPDAEITSLDLKKVSVAGKRHTGALAGFVKGKVRDCSAEDCNISGQYETGGLIGVLYGLIENCIAIGRISSSGSYRESVGGLVGESRGEVSNCSSYVTVSGGGYVGGLVGYNLMHGNINDSWSIATSYGTEAVGGLVGRNAGSISRCYSEGEVYGDRAVGGLVGWSLCTSAPEAMILESYSNADVEAHGYGAGGLVGNNTESIYNCYSIGVVKGNVNTGGLTGNNGGDVRYCYSTGAVFGTGETVGGLVGDRWYDVVVVSSFWDTETSAQTTSAGGMGLTTEQMQTASTFISAGWDFTTPIWTIDEGNDYPRLWWENAAPVACIMGGDKIIEVGISCEARVILDGSCSSDADSTPETNDDIEYFDWYEAIDACDPNSDIFVGSGEVIECNLPLGEHDIILEVTDKAGAFDANEVTITVEDTTAPEFSLTVEPDVLWPANHKMALITPSWEVSDNCDEWPEVTLVSITINEDGAMEDDIQVDDDGIWLRAERSGTGSGRIYTITYQAVDDSGNVTQKSAAVTVPHDRRRSK